MKKYELTNEIIECKGKKLYRIKALIDFGNVEKGARGGFIEKEENLSMHDNAWVYGDAKVCDDAFVSDNAHVCDNAFVSGDAWVRDNAQVSGDARVSGGARVSGDAWVCDNAQVSGDAWVSGDAQVSGDARVYKNVDYAEINGFGTCCRSTTFFRCQDKTIKVSCGCFLGTIDEFRNQVKNTREGKIAKEYLMIADLMEMHFCEAEDEYDD